MELMVLMLMDKVEHPQPAFWFVLHSLKCFQGAEVGVESEEAFTCLF